MLRQQKGDAISIQLGKLIGSVNLELRFALLKPWLNEHHESATNKIHMLICECNKYGAQFYRAMSS